MRLRRRASGGKPADGGTRAARRAAKAARKDAVDVRRDARAAHDDAKAAHADAKAAQGARKDVAKAQKDVEEARRELVTPKNAKRAIAVSKVLVPVLAPVVMQAAGTARGIWDERRARRLGVPAGELGRYTGKGGALHARISRVAESMNELTAAANGHRAADVDRFVSTTTPRLADLSAVVRAAELMPTERRRAVHRAVASELDQIEPELLSLLGVRPAGGHRPE